MAGKKLAGTAGTGKFSASRLNQGWQGSRSGKVIPAVVTCKPTSGFD
ncbi:hypothetical protein [Mariniphaga sediminis]|nr:hypothetical protein [Mariniphaga sediminis]